MGSTVSMFGDISIYFAVFLIAAIAGMISERSGVTNVGIEGFMIIGGLVFAISGNYMNSDRNHNWTQIFALLFAMIIAGGFAMLHAFAVIKLKSNQIISGTAINILAQGIGLYLATSGLFGNESTYIEANYLKISFDGAPNILNLYLVIAIIISMVVGIYFSFTKIGIRHAAVGENPNAVDSAGVSVLKYRYSAVFVSGALSGLAGAIYVIGVIGSKFMGSTGGWGFLSLAIMIVGQWRVRYIVSGAFIFAMFFGVSKYIPALNIIPGLKEKYSDLLRVVPFVLSILTMAIVSKWSKPPKANGIAFDKSKR